jgi:orotidine-5'-phosphate decarboxylase
MTQLIVALDDNRAINAVPRLIRAGVRFFKLDPWALLDMSTYGLVLGLAANCDLFLDLKVYQPRETTTRIAERAFRVARFLTVFADPALLAAASAERTRADQAVLAVGPMTDGTGSMRDVGYALNKCQGVVCGPRHVEPIRLTGRADNTIFVCPGIRPSGTEWNEHKFTTLPSAAKLMGADYVVVGRPIYAASDPAAVATAIMEEIA